MRHVQDNAEECVRRAIEALSDGEYVYPMDPDFDGRPREIRVRITVDRAARSAGSTSPAPPASSRPTTTRPSR